MSVSPAVVFRVALLALLFPVYLVMLRNLRPTPGSRLLGAAFLAIAVSFVASAFGAGATKPYAEAVTHLSIGAAGVIALVAVVSMWRAERERGRA